MSAASGDREFVHADDLRSGLKTDVQLDRSPPHLRVAWIAWDSGFRGSRLRVGDRIVAVDGVAVTRPTDLPELQRLRPRMIGQEQESAEWIARGKKDGSPLRLRVRRRASPGDGWLELEVDGTLRADRSWSNGAQRPIFGPGGPERLERDGFYDAWSGWYERQVFDWERILDEGWQRSLQTRVALAPHLEHKPRVDALVAKYPGPFSEAVLGDWQLVKTCLEGDLISLAPDALAFRSLGEELVRRIGALATKAWSDAKAARADQTLPGFPAIDPFRGDRSSVVGKLVVLPPVREHQWRMDMGKAYLAWNESDFWVFAPVDSPLMARIFDAVRRYEKLVAPGLRLEIELIGRVLPDPRLLAGSGRPAAGLEVEPVAALVGGVVFVDVGVVEDERSPFAGEASIHRESGGPPGDASTPRQVIEAMIAAVKRGDQETWNALFAEWRAVPDADRPIWYPLYPWNGRDEDWIRSRRLLLDRVLDTRVRWVDEPRVIIRGDEAPGLPRIDQVTVEVDHVGQFDGETRVFSSIDVHRQWTLQRRNDGPWRIASRQAL